MASKFQNKLIEEGYCDSRGAGFCATATQLPQAYGMVLLCVNGNMLNLYDVDMKSNAKALLYEVELCRISNLIIKTGLLSQKLQFEYEGFVYSFTNFVGVSPALKVIEEEANRH